MEKEMAVSETMGKDVQVTDEELDALINENAELQAKEAAEDGVRADYICMAKQQTKALSKRNDEFIEGLAIGDFFIQKDKINLGSSLRVVPLAFITVYNQKTNATRGAEFKGTWNQEQALEYPLVDGNRYNRQLPNGDILMPVNWVMVQVLDHPEIENAVIAYKSTGSRIWREWKADAKKRAKSSATLIYTIEEKEMQNDKYDWTDIGFEYAGSLVEADRQTAVFCVNKSSDIRKAYQNHVLVGDRTVEKAPLKEAKAIEEDVYDEDESYGMDDKF